MEVEDYSCVVGHSVLRDALDQETEVRSLDAGAEVRICREHGAPIAESACPDLAFDRESAEESQA